MFADYPDGSREELINIPYYSYLWQLTYNLSEPKLLLPAPQSPQSAISIIRPEPFNPDRVRDRGLRRAELGRNVLR